MKLYVLSFTRALIEKFRNEYLVRYEKVFGKIPDHSWLNFRKLLCDFPGVCKTLNQTFKISSFVGDWMQWKFSGDQLC